MQRETYTPITHRGCHNAAAATHLAILSKGSYYTKRLAEGFIQESKPSLCAAFYIRLFTVASKTATHLAILSKGVTTSRDLLKALFRTPTNVCLLLSTHIRYQWQSKQGEKATHLAILSKGVTTSRDLLKALSRKAGKVCLLLSTIMRFQWQAKQHCLGATSTHLASGKQEQCLETKMNPPGHSLKRGHHIKRLAEGFIQESAGQALNDITG